MQEEAPSTLLYNLTVTVVLLTAVMGYTVLIFQFGRQSAQSTYTLPTSGYTTTFSVHKQKASLIALDMWRVAQALVNETERSILGDMAVHLAARISAMDQVSGQAEQRRLRLVKLARRLLQQIDQSQNPTDCGSAKFIVSSLPKCGFVVKPNMQPSLYALPWPRTGRFLLTIMPGTISIFL